MGKAIQQTGQRFRREGDDALVMEPKGDSACVLTFQSGKFVNGYEVTLERMEALDKLVRSEMNRLDEKGGDDWFRDAMENRLTPSSTPQPAPAGHKCARQSGGERQ